MIRTGRVRPVLRFWSVCLPDLIPAPVLPRLPILDEHDAYVGDFPVGRVICVGRNYADHAAEMGGNPDGAPPFFFIKPADAVTHANAIPFPAHTRDLHHEIELVVALHEGRPFACGVGLDLTRRDVQAEMKSARRPWEAGKVFPNAAACGALRIGAAVLDLPETKLRLTVNGELRQEGRLGQMIHSVPTLLDRIDRLFGVRSGDLLFTGTPAGVGALSPGDVLQACVEGLPAYATRVGERN